MIDCCLASSDSTGGGYSSCKISSWQVEEHSVVNQKSQNRNIPETCFAGSNVVERILSVYYIFGAAHITVYMLKLPAAADNAHYTR